jgi:sporulation protein YlmC with PRC-barrel domain
MRSKLLIGGLLASVMILPALAQSNPPAGSNAPAATPAPSASSSSSSSTSMAQSGLWRASKLVGVNVYNDQNEKLGDINDVLIDKSGKVDGIVIGVGGFLGMGEHDIKVDMSKLKFVDEPVRTSSNANSSANTSATTGAANRPAGSTSASSSDNSKKWYPDHAVLSGATKEQLKAMPQFKY